MKDSCSSTALKESSKMKKDLQARKYQLTINNPLDVKISDPENADIKISCPFSHEEIKERMKTLKSVIYWCMADEIGLEGSTPHTHIYCVANSPIRFSTIKNAFPTAHIEKAYGDSIENRNYILKEGKWKNSLKSETSIEGTFEEYGEIPNNERMGLRGKLQFIYDMIESGLSTAEIIKAYPESLQYLPQIEHAQQLLIEEEYRSTWRDLEVEYIFGATGLGKSRTVIEENGYEKTYRITDYSHPFDGYQSVRHSVLVFEEFRSSLKIEQMLDYLDGYPCELAARYHNKTATYLKVYIISNIPLEEQYSGIQEASPVTWNAFLRRITKVRHFLEDGTIKIYSSVKEYMERNTGFLPVEEEPENPFMQENLNLDLGGIRR